MKNHKVVYNGQEMTDYEASQLQRRMERSIRTSKQELVMYDEAKKNVTTDEEKALWQQEFNNTSVKLKSQEARLKDFCNQTGHYLDTNRTQVFAVATENGIKNYGRSVSQKAVWANKKTVDKIKNKEYNMYRKIHNTGKFKDLKEPMQKSHVAKVIKDMNIDYTNIEIDIIRDSELIGTGLTGYAFPTGNRVQLYPDAFSNREELVKTIGHERIHCKQIELFGQAKSSFEELYYEKGAIFSEEYWWTEYIKRTGFNGYN